jgi:hypothetical protein
MRFCLPLTALALTCPLWAAPVPMREDYQKKADEAPWEWSDGRASAADSAKRLKGDYKAEVEPRGTSGGAVLRIVKDGAVVHFFEGHTRTVFAVRDDVLYYAVYHTSSSGCAVVAFDLRQKKQLWRTYLKGLVERRPHSAYRNAVLLDLDGQAVCVHGKEAFGNYIEFVDRKTGKTVGHRVYPRE